MSDKINDGGPAFPLQDWDPCIQSRRSETGMSMRDWFAGQILTGLAIHAGFINLRLVREAFEAAEECVKVREEARSPLRISSTSPVGLSLTDESRAKR